VARTKGPAPNAAKRRRTSQKPPGGKSISAVEVLLRERAIEALLTRGVGRGELREALLEEHGWDISVRTIDDYLARIRSRLEADGEEERQLRRAVLIEANLALDKMILEKLRARDDLVPSYSNLIALRRLRAQLEDVLPRPGPTTSGEPRGDELHDDELDDLSDKQLETYAVSGKLPHGTS